MPCLWPLLLALIPAAPGGDAAREALARAADGDTVVLAAGRHEGAFRVARRIVLRGERGTLLDGGGRGTVLEIAAPGATVEDLELRGSGHRVITVDAAVKVLGAGGVRLRRLRIRDTLYGIDGERASGIVIEDCTLVGRVPPGREDGDGNGLHLWSCANPVIARDTVSAFVDAVYLSFVDRARVERSWLHDCGRYGLHTMYCAGSRLEGNRFEHNAAGIAIMFSNGLRIADNDITRNRGPRTYGLLLRDCSAGSFENNRLVDNTIAIFMDGSNRNHIRRNLIQDNGWGVILFASCAANEFSGNDFVHDDYPVALDMRHTENRFDDGARGNYWSDAAPYDLDGDGISDVRYSPVSAFAFVSKQYPDLSVLAKSPAVAALAAAERVFPALSPSDCVDRFPLLHAAHRARREGPDGARRPSDARAAVGFGALLAAGLAGLARTRRAA